MTNEILKDCNNKYKELKVATSKVQDVLDVMETDLETVAKKFDTDAVKVSSVKIEFGNMFTGCLTPVNGHNIKDRRYFDEDLNPTSVFEDGSRNSCAVWKGIGRKRSYKKNTSWYQNHQIFDKLKQDHVDLIHNGKYSRRDHKEVAQDFLDIRDNIIAISERLKNETVACVPDTPLPVVLYFIDDGNVVQNLFEATITGWDVSHKGVALNIDPGEELENWKDYIDDSEPFIEFCDPRPTGRMGYGNRYHIDGLVPIFENQDTVDGKKGLDLIAQGILEEMDTLKNKYANRLIVKGVF